MEKLLQDIKNQDFSNIYLLCGEEDYLRKQYRDKMKDALTGEGDDMNYHYFEGKDIKAETVMDLAETLPFFSSRRVIVIENSGWFQKGGDKMAEYLPRLVPTTYFVFVETQTDKRSKLYKCVKKQGRICEFLPQDEQTLKRWIMGMLKKENKTITSNDLQFFLERTGTEMANIKTELEKLLCYTLESDRITREDIEEICTRRVQNQIFDMIDAIGSKDQKKALRLYYDLLTLKEPPMRILALVGRQFNILLQVKELKKRGYSAQIISEKTGLRVFWIGKYEKQAIKFTMQELRAALEDCVLADENVKTGKMQDIMSVEILICKYSAAEEKRETERSS